MNNNTTTEYQCKSPTEEEGHIDQNGEDELETRVEEVTGNKRMKRHREEVKGKVKVPENWKQEQMLKEWVNYTTFDALFAPHRIIVNARDALIADVRKSQRLIKDPYIV